MTDRLVHGSDAMTRIQNRSQAELQEFFDEIPVPSMRPLAVYLPPADGFRRGSQAGIVKQKEILARRLSRPTASSKDFNALYMLWRAWIDATQKNASLIQSFIEELEEAASKAVGPEARRLVIEQHTDSLLQKLKEESEQNRSTREGIERLYIFSPLPETAAAREIISAAKLAADVEREAAYRSLPTRLDKDEREIQAIKDGLKNHAERIATIANESTKIVGELTNHRDEIRKARSHVDSRIKSLTDDLSALRSAVGDLSEVNKKISDAQTQSNEKIKNYATRIELIESTLELMRGEIEALLEDRAQVARIAPLAEKIDELASHCNAISTQLQRSYQAKDLTLNSESARSAFYWTSLQTVGEASAISSFADLVAILTNALLPLGIRKSSAQTLSVECAAAIAARQVIFLQGAFAPRVAKSLAAAIGGAATARLGIPIGVLDGEQLRLAIEGAFSSLDDSVGGLVIEGVNHVPFDIIREIIADCVYPTELLNTSYRRIAVFATLSRGVASLLIEPELLELGPIFDLDYFDWRNNPTPAQPPRASFLPAKVDQEMFSQLTSTSANVEEVVRLLRALILKRNPAIEQCFARAYHALHLPRSDQRTVVPLQSLFYGWLLPYWRAVGLSRELVESEFDGGKIVGAPLDGRLTAMFATEFTDRKEFGNS